MGNFTINTVVIYCSCFSGKVEQFRNFVEGVSLDEVKLSFRPNRTPTPLTFRQKPEPQCFFKIGILQQIVPYSIRSKAPQVVMWGITTRGI